MRMTSPGASRRLAADQPLADGRAVAAVEVAEHPLVAVAEQFRVEAAATFVFEGDSIRGGSSNADGLAGNEPEHVRPFRAFANYQIRQHLSYPKTADGPPTGLPYRSKDKPCK